MFQGKASMVVRKASEASCVIDVQGEVNRYVENILMDAYAKASEGGARNIVLNFERMDFMNSSGIGLLITLLVRIQRQGQRLLAYGLNEHYRQIFELTRLSETIRIYPDEASALQAAEKAI